MDVFNRMGLSRLFSGSALVVPLSFFPTLARAAFLSYFLIFLKERFDLSVDQIGLFAGGFILLSSVSSLVFGSVLDGLSLKALTATRIKISADALQNSNGETPWRFSHSPISGPNAYAVLVKVYLSPMR
ncbi:hypothetical protein PS918_02190 [Pseudomonas fluorescens]|uniref:Uncharacterized protein n=1 Tax=Pseudomonas fluorescens TaxID=294 RepID=A0A5E7RZC9_PSEFL|nr:hypothetical protein [Pseudomonas fluorescens]VVP79871.1 hypothetical protein PS918_02190 [Pseudomonas fluorescens]